MEEWLERGRGKRFSVLRRYFAEVMLIVFDRLLNSISSSLPSFQLSLMKSMASYLYLNVLLILHG